MLCPILLFSNKGFKKIIRSIKDVLILWIREIKISRLQKSQFYSKLSSEKHPRRITCKDKLKETLNSYFLENRVVITSSVKFVT